VVEGFGIATVEALACGLPVVVCDLPINHEITHDKGVLFFQKNDSVDLAKKITLLLSNMKKYRNLSSNAEKTAQNYSLDIVNKPLFKLYEDMLTY
jgi:glycosyltransferase involved in cell wall biosynthesis